LYTNLYRLMGIQTGLIVYKPLPFNGDTDGLNYIQTFNV